MYRIDKYRTKNRINRGVHRGGGLSFPPGLVKSMVFRPQGVLSPPLPLENKKLSPPWKNPVYAPEDQTYLDS